MTVKSNKNQSSCCAANLWDPDCNPRKRRRFVAQYHCPLLAAVENQERKKLRSVKHELRNEAEIHENDQEDWNNKACRLRCRKETW